MPFEDMALMRAIPHMVCFEPTDATMMEKAFEQIADYDGAVYNPFATQKSGKGVRPTLDFQLGKAITRKKAKTSRSSQAVLWFQKQSRRRSNFKGTV